MTDQATKMRIKQLFLDALAFAEPHDQPQVFAELSGQIIEKLSKRDTQRVKTIPREEP